MPDSKYEKVFNMDFHKVYKCLTDKAERKGRTKAEADEIICWLTGYTQAELDGMGNITYGDFFRSAPLMNPARTLITGSVCGVKLNEIIDPLMLDMRRLDKLIDELAKGKSMDKILRSAK